MDIKKKIGKYAVEQWGMGMALLKWERTLCGVGKIPGN